MANDDDNHAPENLNDDEAIQQILNIPWFAEIFQVITGGNNVNQLEAAENALEDGEAEAEEAEVEGNQNDDGLDGYLVDPEVEDVELNLELFEHDSSDDNEVRDDDGIREGDEPEAAVDHELPVADVDPLAPVIPELAPIEVAVEADAVSPEPLDDEAGVSDAEVESVAEAPAAEVESVAEAPAAEVESVAEAPAAEAEFNADAPAADPIAHAPAAPASSSRPHQSGPKGTGKGGARRGNARRQRAQKPTIEGITKPAIRRLARRGGVKRISGLIYAETRSVLKVFLENIIRDSVTYCEHAKRKTVTAMDVVYALKRRGRTLYGFGG
uniref:Histone H4 n=1 Tax=Panagrellus redivivus TaxID=6233 RepID=A0A7E4USQ5_PANRE